MSKRLLVFSYHYPPSTEVGAVRWHRMAESLSASGWHISVVAKEPDDPPIELAETSSQARLRVERIGVVHRHSLLLRIAESRKAMRALFPSARHLATAQQAGKDGAAATATGATGLASAASDDAPSVVRTLLALAQEMRWARDAALRGRPLASDSIVLSAGPPHSVHHTASRLARRLGLPHVIDMRDPWSLVERGSPWLYMPLWRGAAGYLEARSVRRAALIVCNTELAAEAMRVAHPEAAERIIAIMNGADPQDIPGAVEWSGRKFLCVHSGSVYIDRMPEALLRAARTVIDRLALTPDDFGIAFRGVVEEHLRVKMAQLAHSLDLAPYVEILPRIERQEALRWTAAAQVCVVLPQDSKMALPSKVFELAQLRSWLLAFAPTDSATAAALRGTTAMVVAPDDDTGAANALSDAIKAFRSGHRPSPVDVSGSMLREKQVEKMRAHLERLDEQFFRKS